jgi:hypothetical protein
MSMSEDGAGWSDHLYIDEQFRERLKADRSIIRRFAAFLIRHRLIKEQDLSQISPEYQGHDMIRNVKTMKILGFDTGFLHSYDGPALIDTSGDGHEVEHAKEYYIYGLKYSEAKWKVLVKKHKIELIKKGK